jgi:sec-independent protein translocase protein TatC
MRNTLKVFWCIITAPFRFIARILRNIARWISGILGEIRSFFTEEVEDAPVGDAIDKAFDRPQELLDHLDALRRHLFRAIAFLAITTAISFTFNRQIIDLLSRPIGGIESLVAIEVTEPISTVMRVSLLSGFALAFPYIALEIWMFVAPGLKRRSRLYGLFAIPISTIFFIGGMAFAYLVMLPTALPFLLNFMGIQTIPRPSNYIKFTTGLMVWIGISFEFPLVIFLLAKMGFIKAKTLAQQWRIAIVVIAVVSAMVTPTIDPVNMALVMGPLILLYYLSVLLAKIAQPMV